MIRTNLISFGLVATFMTFGSASFHEVFNQLSAQQPDCDCNRLTHEEENRILVTYERVSKRISQKENDTVWFRLRNGTHCDIFVPTDHEYGFQSATGKLILEIQDGSVVFVLHQVKKAAQGRTKTGPRGYHWVSYMGGTKYATRLQSGRSLLFYIPIANLKRGSYLAVPYQCQRASRFDGKTPRILFNLEKLPDSALNAQ